MKECETYFEDHCNSYNRSSAISLSYLKPDNEFFMLIGDNEFWKIYFVIKIFLGKIKGAETVVGKF